MHCIASHCTSYAYRAACLILFSTNSSGRCSSSKSPEQALHRLLTVKFARSQNTSGQGCGLRLAMPKEQTTTTCAVAVANTVPQCTTTASYTVDGKPYTAVVQYQDALGAAITSKSIFYKPSNPSDAEGEEGSVLFDLGLSVSVPATGGNLGQRFLGAYVRRSSNCGRWIRPVVPTIALSLSKICSSTTRTHHLFVR